MLSLRQNARIFAWKQLGILLLVLGTVLPVHSQAPVPPEELPYSYADLASCNRTSAELVAVNEATPIQPCILYDTLPNLQPSSNRTTIITVVGVFNNAADMHRDGGVVAAQQLNQDNQGRGAAIGYYRDHYIQLRLIIGIAGNRNEMGPEQYAKAHATMLQVMLEDVKPHYILGTSSFDSDIEREYAGVYKTMLVAQVGPQSYFTSNRSNDHVFGAHIPSEGYGIPAFQALRFSNDVSPQTQKLRVVYRDRSEFFYSTCRAVIDKALEEGYNQTKAIEYNPDADEDGNGVLNSEDPGFLQGLADQACSPDEASDNIALWGCFWTDTEVNVFLERLRENQCRLSNLWLTVASWAWPNTHPESVPYIQSGGQWHLSMQYGDEYFANGQELLDHMTQQFDYVPSYGALGAYHAVYLMFANIRSFFKGKDEPSVKETFASDEGYEELRRAMMGLSLPHTLYGPTAFDEHRRNVGRGSAGMQWNIPSDNHKLDNDNIHDGFELLLVSPIDQATSAAVFPAPVSEDCPPGSFVNVSVVADYPDLLSSACNLCPADTFQDETNSDSSCKACAAGSTEGQEGATICVEVEDNLVPRGLHVFGYVILAIVYSLAIGFALWTVRHREDPVVRIGQLEFLLLICMGPVISSSSIIALSFQASSFEDETAASRACTALPWLYTTGWVLQYGSLSAKSYRMYSTMKAAETVQGRTVTAFDTYKLVAMLLVLNWAIVLPWTVLDPLVWERQDKGIVVDEDEGVLTYESYGRCTCNHLAAWVGPTLGLHFMIMVFTNWLLYKIRSVNDRYQESKYVAMASAYACEFLIVGIPILIAVGENAVEASYIVLVCIVGLSDMGILLMIFVPKIRFSRKGLPEGVSVGQSIFKRNAPFEERSLQKQQRLSSGEDPTREMSEQCARGRPDGKNLMRPRPRSTGNISIGSRSVQSANGLAELVQEGVDAEPVPETKETQHDLKKQDDGALVNCMTLQW